MLKSLGMLVASCFFFFLSQRSDAAVIFNFDADAQGFSTVSWNTASGSIAWSANNGGSLAVSTSVAGWSNPIAFLSLTSTPELQAEFNLALANGGTISFDYIVSNADVVGYNPATPPGWFELVAVANSDTAVGGGYDQQVIGSQTGYYGPVGIPNTPTTRNVTMGIAAGAPADNNVLNFGVGSGWNELMIGFNSEGGSFTSATVYIDNLTITATAVPEPTGITLLALSAVGGIAFKARRSVKKL